MLHRTCVSAAVWAILAVCWTHGALGQAQTDGFRTPVNGFVADNVRRIDALVSLARARQIPLGIEYAGPLLFERVTLRANATAVAAALDALLPAAEGFRVSNRDGVVLVGHADLATTRTLDVVLPSLAIARSGLQYASVSLWMRLASYLRPGIGLAGSILGPLGRPIGPIAMTQRTVRDGLNEIVRAHGRAAWVVTVGPARLQNEPTEMFWTILDYDELPGDPGRQIDQIEEWVRESSAQP